MSDKVVEVSVTPSFILHDREYSESSVSYDPSTAVLMYQWNRALAGQQRALVFPSIVEGHALEVIVARAPRDAEASVRDDGSIVLPALYQGEEFVADLTFSEPSSATGLKLPKFKVTTTIRGRPQGGG
jgi:hypothetical protein